MHYDLKQEHWLAVGIALERTCKFEFVNLYDAWGHESLGTWLGMT